MLLSRRKILATLAPALIAGNALLRAAEPPQKQGSLLLCGGGRPYDSEVLDEFWRLAGGKEARIVVVPTAATEMDSPDTAPRRIALVTTPWKERGVKEIVLRHTLSRTKAEENAFWEPLSTATGVWLSGGDQRRLLDTYRDTRIQRELTALVQRGGVVGGSSAGTAVLSELAIVGQREGKLIVEPGFNLLPGTILDQHFLARDREGRLKSVLKEHVGLVGIGVDEYTALIVQGTAMHVVGKSSVSIYQPSKNHDFARRTYRPGDEFQL